MACSFFKIETTDQIEKFISKNSNFIKDDFNLLKNKYYNYSKLIKNSYMINIPNKIFSFNIDGFFAAYLKKIK